MCGFHAIPLPSNQYDYIYWHIRTRNIHLQTLILLKKIVVFHYIVLLLLLFLSHISNSYVSLFVCVRVVSCCTPRIVCGNIFNCLCSRYFLWKIYFVDIFSRILAKHLSNNNNQSRKNLFDSLEWNWYNIYNMPRLIRL